MTLAPTQPRLFGPPPGEGLVFDFADAREVNPLLASHHYLGPLSEGGYVCCIAGFLAGDVVACQVWRQPTARLLPSDGSWLELSRWCLTPRAGPNAGSRMHRWSRRALAALVPAATTLVSYSDPSIGHTGALYRACNWRWAPTHHRLRLEVGDDGGYASRHGAWSDGAEPEEAKDRWVFPLRRDACRRAVLATPCHPALRPAAEAAGMELWEAEGKWWAAPARLS